MAKTNTFGKPDWFDLVESEYEACRENVSLLDYSSFTKLDIQVSKPKISFKNVFTKTII